MIGTGADGALPVMQQLRDEARRRKVDLQALGSVTVPDEPERRQMLRDMAAAIKARR